MIVFGMRRGFISDVAARTRAVKDGCCYLSGERRYQRYRQRAGARNICIQCDGWVSLFCCHCYLLATLLARDVRTVVGAGGAGSVVCEGKRRVLTCCSLLQALPGCFTFCAGVCRSHLVNSFQA